MSTYLVCSSKSYQAIDDENMAKPYMVVSGKKLPLTTQTDTTFTYGDVVKRHKGVSSVAAGAPSAFTLTLYTKSASNATSVRYGTVSELINNLFVLTRKVSLSTSSSETFTFLLGDVTRTGSNYTYSNANYSKGTSKLVNSVGVTGATSSTSFFTKTSISNKHGIFNVSNNTTIGSTGVFVRATASTAARGTKYTFSGTTLSSNKSLVVKATSQVVSTVANKQDYRPFDGLSTGTTTGNVTNSITNTGSNIYATNNSIKYKVLNVSSSQGICARRTVSRLWDEEPIISITESGGAKFFTFSGAITTEDVRKTIY